MIRLALRAASSGSTEDLPIAAVIVDGDGAILSSSRNCVVANGQFTAHAELLAMGSVPLEIFKREAQSMTLAVTLEP
ncbi:tRNA-specific adenosine deaminase, partial [Aquiluna sp.]|nr:tRNA-specific adenosine deaminase [Aquiluna sp.]